jgi:hypothetical protein
LLAERLAPERGAKADPDRPGPIRLTARMGAFGNPAREERLIRAVGDRLGELAGRPWAPVK